QSLGADQMTPTACLGPSATTSIAYTGCPTNFFINVTVTNLNGATGADVFSDYSGNPGGVTNQPLGTYQLGPFSSGSTVVVTLRRNGDPTCNNVLSAITGSCSDANNNALSFDGIDDRV